MQYIFYLKTEDGKNTGKTGKKQQRPDFGNFKLRLRQKQNLSLKRLEKTIRSASLEAKRHKSSKKSFWPSPRPKTAGLSLAGLKK
jgi:hypothetical protein